MTIHKAIAGVGAGGALNPSCQVCGQPVKRVPGGTLPVWVHKDSGAVVAKDPPDVEARKKARVEHSGHDTWRLVSDPSLSWCRDCQHHFPTPPDPTLKVTGWGSGLAGYPATSA